MRVLFDGYWWARGPIANRMVMRETILAWARMFPEDQLTIAVRRRHRDVLDDLGNLRITETRLPLQALVNLLELPLIAKRRRIDLVFSHNYATPFARCAVFIHDLLFEESPTWFTAAERAYFWPMGRLARVASTVLTSSQTEARRIVRLHPNLHPVHATGLGVSRSLAQAVPARPAFLSRDVRSFFLCVGRLNRRKNLGVAIEGAIRSGRLSANRPLIIVGSAEYSGLGANLPHHISKHVSLGQIVFAGRVSDNELSWMYRYADGLIFMSRDEGYGLPPAEATYFGTPVIATDIPVMREVVPHAEAFVSPDDALSLASAIQRIPTRSVVSPATGPADEAWNEVARAAREAVLESFKKSGQGNVD